MPSLILPAKDHSLASCFYDAFVSALNLAPSEFHFVSGVEIAGPNPCEFSTCLDEVPQAGRALAPGIGAKHYFSAVYGEMLSSLNSGFSLSIAQKAYASPDYWLDSAGSPPGEPGVNPVYSPALADLYEAVDNGPEASFGFTWPESNGSNDGTSIMEKARGHESALSAALAKCLRVRVQMALSKYAMVPINAGGWYNSGLFASAYSNQGMWTNGPNSPLTWQQTFGEGGLLTQVFTDCLVVDGYSIAVTLHGQHTEDDVLALRSSNDISIWPPFTHHKNAAFHLSFTLNKDQSITITLTCSPGTYQILGYNVRSVPSLFAPPPPMPGKAGE